MTWLAMSDNSFQILYKKRKKKLWQEHLWQFAVAGLQFKTNIIQKLLRKSLKRCSSCYSLVKKKMKSSEQSTCSFSVFMQKKNKSTHFLQQNWQIYNSKRKEEWHYKKLHGHTWKNIHLKPVYPLNMLIYWVSSFLTSPLVPPLIPMTTLTSLFIFLCTYFMYLQLCLEVKDWRGCSDMTEGNWQDQGNVGKSQMWITMNLSGVYFIL